MFPNKMELHMLDKAWYKDQMPEVTQGFSDKKLLLEMEENFKMNLEKHAKFIRAWTAGFKALQVIAAVYKMCKCTA